MKNQSKILSLVLVGLAVSAAIGVLFSLAGDKELLANFQSSKGDGNAAAANDWSELNDSLGG
jgi:hypothetical protein